MCRSHQEGALPIASPSILLVLSWLAACGWASEPDIAKPTVVDKRLKIELFAAEPDIVTPFGITVVSPGRVLVVESHTHMRPDDYDGPPHDRLRLLIDDDGDGRCDHARTFYEGDQWLMNAAVHPNGWVYLVSRNELFRLLDADGDGRSDRRETLAKMETSGDYPHNGFLSLTFDLAGNVYFGMGQNYGASYVLRGNDGRAVSSVRGDGGIFRCTEEGRGLERLALGFWNPCGLSFDAFGRLFTVDNDPGNRPPCRLLEVVTGGDFGYRRHALEPFISWNGELPGTLPMIASTPEAPTAIVAYERDYFPADYRGELIVSSWSEYRIDRFRLAPDGASFTATSRPLVIGADEFRPAGMAVAPDGSMFVSDWVDRSYPVHGRGRVWRISSATAEPAKTGGKGIASADGSERERAARSAMAEGAPGVQSIRAALRENLPPRSQATALMALVAANAVGEEDADLVLNHPAAEVRELAVRSLPSERLDPAQILSGESHERVRAAALRRANDLRSRTALLSAAQASDRFLRQAAVKGLQEALPSEELTRLVADPRAAVRHAALLALRERAPDRADEWALPALSDPDDQVVFSAVEWIAQRGSQRHREPLLELLRERPLSPQLFEAVLAAVAQLDGVMDEWRPGRNGDWWKSKSNANEIAAELLSEDVSREVVRRAIEFLPAGHPSLTHKFLTSLLHTPAADTGLQVSAVRALQSIADAAPHLRELALDDDRPIRVRAEAIVGLDPDRSQHRAALLELASNGPLAIRHEALRTLGGIRLSAEEARLLEQLSEQSSELRQRIQLLLKRDAGGDRPPETDTDAWLERLSGEPDPAVGERIFFHPRGPGCGKCHRVDGRGSRIGPAFVRTTGVPLASRRRLLEAILQPSREMALGYVPLQFLLVDGTIQTGIPRTEHDDEYELYDTQGNLFRVRRAEIDELHPATKSIMPDGLQATLTDGDLRDLLAYLMRGVESP